MNGIIWLLALLGLLGFVPLLVFLYKRRRTRNLIAKGRRVIAQIYAVENTPRYNSATAFYSFYLENKGPYTGKLTTRPGRYSKGSQIMVYYHSARPQLNTVEGAWESKVIFIFTLAIGLFVLFAVFQLYKMAAAEGY